MFEDILVNHALLEVREAACQQDLPAMVRLTEYILHGKETPSCPKTAKRILRVIYNHPDLRKDMELMWHCFMLSAQVNSMLLALGEIDRATYQEWNAEYLQAFIISMIALPPEQWQLKRLQECIALLEEYA